MNKGLYVHIPFCKHICGYCDFARGYYNQDLADKYLISLAKELSLKDLDGIETIYIGGGTPTALSDEQLEKLLKMLSKYNQKVKEYTIEINPETLTISKTKLLSKYKINRASIGMQVSQKHLLNLIERKHTFLEVKEKVEMLQALGINNISIDLMYGIPSQTLEDLKETLSKIISLNIQHISLYALTIEPNSKFGLKGYKEAEADLDADMYEYAVKFLKENNFDRYEVSSFAKNGFQSMHNKVYWHYQDFVGVGLNASGKEKSVRYTNTRSLKKYNNFDYQKDKKILSKNDEIFEYIMMNLRLSEGLNVKDFKQRFNLDFIKKYKQEIEKLVKNKLLVIKDDYVFASDYGLEILHEVIIEFMMEED